MGFRCGDVGKHKSLEFVAIVSFISSTYLSAAPFSTLPPGHPSVGSSHFPFFNFQFSGSHSAMPALPLRDKTWIKVKSAVRTWILSHLSAG